MKKRSIINIHPRPPEDERLVDQVRSSRLQTLYAEKALIERTIHLIKTMGALGIVPAPCSPDPTSDQEKP